MDNQIVFDLFFNTIRAAEALGVDNDYVRELKATRKLMTPMHIGKHRNTGPLGGVRAGR
ncbi:alpha-L-fucosidase 2 [Pedobacter sp. ok626]|nr:hypothetical protein [Pedobacter sp. ok626]SDL65173.1 alpha-L-fucosidase 2 [Pedobacter sp. ok626]